VQRSVRTTVVAPVLAGVLAVCAIAVAGQWSGHGSPPTGPTRNVLRVHGNVDQLIPGRSRILAIRVRNPTDAPITIERLRTTVRRSGVGSCRAWMLIVPSWHGHRRIPPHSRTIVRVRVRLRARVSDRCQGGTWRFHYHVTGSGVKHP
jgi:hypothetical protein